MFKVTLLRHRNGRLLAPQDQIFEPTELSKAALKEVHSDAYLQQLHTSSKKVASVIELPPVALLPISLVQRLLLRKMRTHVAGTVLAVGLAAEFGCAINLGGGMHHAHRDDGANLVRRFACSARAPMSKCALNVHIAARPRGAARRCAAHGRMLQRNPHCIEHGTLPAAAAGGKAPAQCKCKRVYNRQSKLVCRRWVVSLQRHHACGAQAAPGEQWAALQVHDH